MSTDYGRPVGKSLSLHSRRSNRNPKFLGTAKEYFVCRIGPNFQISLIYAFTWCPYSVHKSMKKAVVLILNLMEKWNESKESSRMSGNPWILRIMKEDALDELRDYDKY